jgi:NitT/TauT family transport system ATP-binding protein
MEMNSAITIRALTKRFGSTEAIRSLSLEIDRGLITTILAPSGAGKTTLLRMIAGLDFATEGTVEVNGHAVIGPSLEMGLVSQEPSIFPWLTVRQNLDFGLALQVNQNRNAGSRWSVDEITDALGLRALLDRYPRQLSGGQQQRVVIGRSLILSPHILLCDEPFSALDEVARNDLRILIANLHVRYLPTVLFITHSIDEALFLGDNVVICSGPPLSVVEHRTVTFSQPRNLDLLETEEFQSQRRQIRRVILQSSDDGLVISKD